MEAHGTDVVAERNDGGLFIPNCPHCRMLHTLQEEHLSRSLACPISAKLLKVGSRVGMQKAEKKAGAPAAEESPEIPGGEGQADVLVVLPDEGQPAASETNIERFKPERIKAHLDSYMIGQEQAKLEMATALYYHILALEHESRQDRAKLASLGPLLFAGPTGCGKTFLIETACRYAGLPFVHVNAAAMVSEGIVGTSIGDIAKNALRLADLDVGKAEYAVVFLDEFDKTMTIHPYGQGVLSQLLRVIEGDTIPLNPGMEGKGGKTIRSLSTRHMLFVLGGAFQDIFDKAGRRPPGYVGSALEKERKLSVRSIEKEMNKRGVPREFLGRVRSIVIMSALGEKELLAIMRDSLGSPLKKYRDMVEAHGDQVEFEQGALESISRAAAASGIGARALEEILYRVFQPILYVAPRQERTSFAVTRREVELLLQPGAERCR